MAEPMTVGERYQLGPVIGQGGMAVVHDGRDRRLHRPVAVKLLRQELAHQPVVRRRFESEAHLAARLSHPNVVSVLDSGEEGGRAYIVMERLSGRTLHDEIARGPLAVATVHQLTSQMLSALTAAHGAGIVHRDIKPGNILAGPAGEWKLGDFGIAKAAELPGGDHTATGLLIGTPAYLAPERFFSGEATVQSDLYALGVVLYEAVAGRKPFEAATPHEWLLASATAPAPVGPLRPDVDPALAEAIGRCLAPRPEQRFGSAAEMAAAIAGPTSWNDVPPAGAWPSEPAPTAVAFPAQPAQPAPTAVLAPVDRPGRSGRPRPLAALGGRHLVRTIAVASAVVIVGVVLLVSAVNHPSRPTRNPSPSTTTPAAGSLPPGLDQALRRLQDQVQH